MRIPPAAWRLLRPLAVEARRRGLALYAVGGCVRDWRLGRPVYDLDVVVEGDPRPLAELCAKRLGGLPEAFDRFGTLRVLGPGRFRMDFATARRETYPAPAALPEVSPAPIREDLFRRDFTVNAMAWRLEPEGPGELIDPHDGGADLKARRLRLLHDASFRDDPTRVFRAARYSCRFGLRPAPGLLALAAKALAAGHAARLSRHRLAQELWRVLGEEAPGCALRKLSAWGYLDLVYPRLPAPAPGLSSVEERLASVAVGLGRRGRDFLDSLQLERAKIADVRETLELSLSGSSPRGPAPAIAERVLKGLPKSALKPQWLSGADLQEIGLAPGKAYGEILDEAAKLQWKGRLISRRQALAWLKRRAG